MAAQFRFDNTYVRLPDRFYARIEPTSVSGAEVDPAEPGARACNSALTLMGSQARKASRSWLASASRCGRADCSAYAGHQFGQLRSATRRWARHPAWRGRRPRWRASGHPAQGLRSDAVLAPRGRAGGSGAGPAGVPRQRGHGSARHSDNPGPRRGGDRGDGDPRDAASRCGSHPRGIEPYSRRLVPVLRGP